MIFNLLLIISIIIIYFIIKSQKTMTKSTKDTIFLIIVFILFFIIVGFRGQKMGNDTITYLKLFKQCSLSKWDMNIFNNYYEPGYLIFNILLSYISSNTRFFMLVMSFIFNFTIIVFIKKESKNPLASVLLYIGFLHFYSSMTMMRQFTAIIIVLMSLKYTKEKKLFKYILMILLAMTFHSSAIIAILLYPLKNIKFSKKNLFAILIISIISVLFTSQLYQFVMGLLGRNTYYLSRIGLENTANMLYSFLFFIIFIISYYFSKKYNNIEKNSFYLYTFFLIAAIDLIATNMNILSRADDYFSILSIIFIPNIIEENVKIVFNKKIIYLVLVLLVIIFSSTIIIFRPEWNTAYNYKICIVEQDCNIFNNN